MDGSLYLCLCSAGQLSNLKSKLGDFQAKFYENWDTPENLRSREMLALQPLKEIHLQSHMEQEMGENSNVTYLYIFAAIAFFILLIASVNFINLNISLAFRRMKETGLRKVMGAARSQLIKQYLAETLVTSAFALVLALCLFFAIIPNYNSLAGRDVQMVDVLKFDNLGIMIGLILVVSLLSGAYPAFFMSKYQTYRSTEEPERSGIINTIHSKSTRRFSICCVGFHDRQHAHHHSTDELFSEPGSWLQQRSRSLDKNVWRSRG